MNLADRLRAVVRSGGSGELDTLYTPHPNGAAAVETPRGPGGADTSMDPANTDRIANVLGGEWREARGRSASANRPDSAGLLGRAATRPRYFVIDRQYSAEHRLGRVAVADCLPAADGLWPRLDLLMCGGGSSGALRGRLLFVDLETTGLAGGAGTYAFLVGCGWFEGAAFRVRQFFLSSYAAERGLLEDVADTMGASGALVTYNGKTFDLPLIDTRFLFHRMRASHNSLPHLDMLHPVRRLWRPQGLPHSPMGAGERAAPCRLTLVEQSVLGHVRGGDVPGFKIPSCYFHYVRTGDARPLVGVMEHNRLDLLALAMLTARAARLLEEGAAGARTTREALGLGRLYEHGGMIAEARACFARAAGADLPAFALCASAARRGGPPARTAHPAVASRVAERPDLGGGGTAGPGEDGDPLALAEALRAYGALCRRERRYTEAATAWRRVLALRGCPARIAQEATEALAVHHEHRVRDLSAARRFAMHALQFSASTTRVQAVHHRLARIDRKLGVSPPQPAPLF